MPSTAPDLKEFPITWEKGLVTEVEESTLELGQAVILENFEPTAQGGLRTRNAWDTISKKGLVSSPSIPAATLWLKADAITGLNDGDPVTTWEDSSANGYDATQATGANKPTYQTDELNGKPVLRFDGTDDWMETAAFSGGELANTTIFVVAKKTADGSIAQALYDGLISGKRNAQVNIGSHDWTIQSGGSSITGSDSDASWHVFTATFQGSGNDSFYVDGRFDVGGDTGGNALSGLTIGSRHDQALPFGGDIAEILVYDGVLSTVQQEDVEVYLSLKYGITVQSEGSITQTFNVRGFGAIASGTAVAGAITAPVMVQSDDWPDGIDADPVSTKTLTLTGVNIGNVLIAYVGVDSTASPTVTGGWTERAVSTGDEQRVRFYTKVATASTEAFTYTISTASIRAMSLLEMKYLPGEDPGTAWAADAILSGSGGSSSNSVNNTDTDGAFTLVGYVYDGGTPDSGDSGTSGWSTPTLVNSNPRTGVAFEDLDQLDGFVEDSDASTWEYTTPSWTPPASGLVIVLVYVADNANTTGLSVVGNGLTWHDAFDAGELGVQINGINSFSYAWADCAEVAPAAGTITVTGTQSGANPGVAMCHFVKAVGGDTTDPFVQKAVFNQGTVGTGQDGPILAALQTGSGILGIAANQSNGADDPPTPVIGAGNFQAALDTFAVTDTVGAHGGATTQCNSGYINSAFPPDTESWFNYDVSGFATTMVTYEIKGAGNAARVYRGTVTSAGTMIEDFAFIANKRMVAKMVSWGYTPPTTQPDAVDFFIVMALAINSTTYKIYQIPRDDIESGEWELIDTVTDATNSDAFVSFAQGAGHLIWSSSTMGHPRAIELATLSQFNITDMLGLAGRTAAYHKDRMFIAGSAQNPSRMYFSDIGDPLSFTTATDFLDIGGDDGEAIQDVLTVEGLLMVCKTNRLYLISGSGIESFFVNELPGGSAASGRCAVRTPYGTIVAGVDDIWVVQGGAVDPMSRPLGAGYVITGNVSTAYAQDSALVVDSGSGNVWRANLVTGAWMLEPTADTANPNPLFNVFSLNGRLYHGMNLGETEVGGTRQLSSSRDYDKTTDGLVCRAATGRMSMLGPSYRYTPRFLWMQLRAQDPTMPNELLGTIESDIGTEEFSVRVTSETQRVRKDLGRYKGAEWLKLSLQVASSAQKSAIDVEKTVLGVISEKYR